MASCVMCPAEPKIKGIWCSNKCRDLCCKQLWEAIGNFETKERKHESKNTTLGEARAGARMEAYVKLFERLLDD